MSFVFVVWFVSGIVMMYTGGMPATTDAERLERAATLDLGRVRITPAEALEAADARGAPSRVSLETVLDRPVYRFEWFRGSTSVFADTGRVLDEIAAEAAVRVAAAFARVPESAVTFVRTVHEPDQWTLTLRGDLPLHRLDVADGARTQVYVSPRTGDVSLATTRATRALAWAGAIPHWFYFTPLRVNQPLWYWLVVWLSAIGCVLAVLGLILGIVQSLPSKRAGTAASSRYRGWMRWHYVSGIVFGVVALTWVFSGMLSMEPFTSGDAGLDLPGNVLSGGPLELEPFPRPDPDAWSGLVDPAALKQIELLRIHDEPFYLARSAGPGRERMPGAPSSGTVREQPRARPLLVAARTMTPRAEPFATESILARVRGALDGVSIEEQTLLDDYDAYYYARGGAAPLPVLRVKLGDADASWYYIDPRMSEVVYRVHEPGRWQRWLFNGLHSLDFAFWYDRRPLWDVGVILLSLGALASSLSGAYLGVKRLRRDTKRLTSRLISKQGPEGEERA